MKDYLAYLNKEQYEAATTINGPLLIIAGAGSGKTMTLVSRIAYMIDQGIDPESILLLTFTNKAANEMKNRIIKNIGEAADGITASTFHSFCALFLRKHAHIIKFNNNFTIIDTSDAADVMGIVRDEFVDKKKKAGYEFDVKSFPDKRELQALYSYAINNCECLTEAIYGSKFRSYRDDINEIFNKYICYKQDHALLDYDDLLFYTKYILEEYEDVRRNISKKYKYVCSDEYQDTNRIQDIILDLICRDHKNLAVVGDENQSIYKFRGAKIENILTFAERHPGCKTIVLFENYRSSQEILNLSNAVMDYATEGTKKVLHGQFSGAKPELMIVKNEIDETYKIVNLIRDHYRFNKIPLHEMAVIVRSSSQSYRLEMLLTKMGIPYNKFGGLKFLEKVVVRDILSFLRIITNEKDEIALYRILQLYPGIGKGYSGKITAAVAEKGLSVLPTLYPKAGFHQYLEELYERLMLITEMSLDDQLSHLLESYYPYVTQRTIDASKKSEGQKMDDKKKLFNGIDDARALYTMAEGQTKAKKFLEDLVLESTGQNDVEGHLNITTIHSAKGLEYDVVFFMDVIEDFTPKCKEGKDEEAEELRCFYVALTRARKYLYLFVPTVYSTSTKFDEVSNLSRFLSYDDVLEQMKLPFYDIKHLREPRPDIY